jgi:hypothetical protein
MRHFAIQRIVGNWDSYGWERGKNDYLYGTLTGGFIQMPWDIDYSLGLGRPANEPLFASNDPRISAMFNTPAIVRAYWRAFEELVNGPFTREYLEPFIDTRAGALINNGVNIDLTAVAAIKAFIDERRAYVQSQLTTVEAPFAVDIPLAITTTNNLLVITGTAPIRVKYVTINGGIYPVTWISVTNFYLRLVLESGMNAITIAGLDRLGNPVSGAGITVSAEYTGPVAEPVGSLVITEVLFAAPSTGAQFIEIANLSQLNFDLSGWRVDGANLTFPLGSIVTNGQTLILARNRAAFRSLYGSVPVFSEFGSNLSAQEQTLALVKVSGTGERLIDALTYERVAPWPAVTNGVSLQLMDPLQDNSRPSNWAADPVAKATPGLANSVLASLPPYDPLWLNEVHIVSLDGLLDNMGEPEPWLELYNSGDVAIGLDGYFLADAFEGAANTWSFPSGLAIFPGEYLLLWMDGEVEESAPGELHTTMRLGESGKLALVRTFNEQPQLTDYLRWNLPGANVSYGSSPDGQCVYRFNLHTPSGRSTNIEPPVRIFINEWLTRNNSGLPDPADDTLSDWFEIYNAESRTVDLGGFYVTDDAAVPRKYRIPQTGRYRIAPGGFLLVWADNQPEQNAPNRADLHVPFALSSSFGDVGLFAPDGVTPIDVISYFNGLQDVSEGRYSDGASVRYLMPKTTPRGRNSITNFNSKPLFPTLTNVVASPGQRLVVALRPSDPDAPPQVLSYMLESGPAGSGATSGVFFWQIPTNQPPGDHLITVRVTDNGVPPRSDTGSFILSIRSIGDPILAVGPVIQSFASFGGQATFTIETIPGHTYRVLYKDDLNAPTWTQFAPDFVAANTIASITQDNSAPARFYVVQQLD